MLKPFHNKSLLEAGCDEAGRGCLAGPVYAAAVILPQDYRNAQLNDSKQLSEKQRYLLRDVIINDAIAWAVASVDNEGIDRMNILRASFHAMNLAVKKLNVQPQFLLIDGNKFINETPIPHLCIIKGDANYMSIAAASILAKTFRDDFMMQCHELYPLYDWNSNKGYPTPKHYDAIEKHGISPLHRKSYKLNRQLELPL